MAKKLKSIDKVMRTTYDLSIALDLHSAGLTDSEFNLKENAAPHKVVEVVRQSEYIDVDLPDDELWKMARKALRTAKFAAIAYTEK